MNELISILKYTGVEMNIRVDEHGSINVEFKKDDWHYRKVLSQDEYLYSRCTNPEDWPEDWFICQLKEFLNDLKRTQTNPVELAYELLVTTYNTKNVTKEDAIIAIEEAIGYLGEALE